jgi:ribosomal protein S18 acetylase RimI-like enzyme
MRCAELTDAPLLVELWGDALRRVDEQDQIADLELLIKAAVESPEQRFVVAEYDGELAGAVFLRLTTLTAVNLEPVVEAVSPHVFPQFRRHGIGSSLIECAVSFAEELGAAHVMTAAASGSRDANRFMARLGLGPYAVTRVALAPAVRAKVTAQRPGLSTNGGRHLTRVLAARRSMKRTPPLR